MTPLALSLKQPWAALVVAGVKTIEVRRWATGHRGPLLIHAANVPDERPGVWERVPAGLQDLAARRGGILGEVVVTGCKAYRTAAGFEADQALHLNDPEWFEPGGLFGFEMAEARALPFRRYPGWVRLFSVEATPPAQAPRCGRPCPASFTSARPASAYPNSDGGRHPPEDSPPGGAGSAADAPGCRRDAGPFPGRLSAAPPGLLVSVRSAEEVEAAVAGGATLLDVKDPSRGSLGRADAAVVRAVVRQAAGRVPVSVAGGEYAEAGGDLLGGEESALAGCAFVKWGPARLATVEALARAHAERVAAVARAAPGCEVVLVAYADWRQAGAPPPEEVAGLACRVKREGVGAGVLLIDTFAKPAPTLLAALPVGKVELLCRLCRTAGVRVALAGSLGRAEIEALRVAAPDWFAVRGAVCEGGRGGAVEEAKVRELAAALGG